MRTNEHEGSTVEAFPISGYVPAGDGKASVEDRNRTLYLDLMKRVLLNVPYGHVEEKPFHTSRKVVWRWLGFAVKACGARISWPKPFDPQKRAIGRGWPSTAHTMIGLKRLDNIEHCVRDVLERNVPGDFIETGVWRGGATIFMRAILESYGVRDRRVWVADSFQGLPPPDREKYPADANSTLHKRRRLRISLEQVKANFNAYGLLDDQVRFLKGWFSETLPTAPIERLAVIRLDGDLYGSTMDAITNLYPKLSVGGYLIVDDYGSIRVCRQAIEDYRAAEGISEEITPIDWTGVFWKRTSPGSA